MYLSLTIIVITLNIVIGLFAFLKNPKSATHKLFLLLTFILSLWAFTNYLSLTGNSLQETLFRIRVVMAITAAMFPCLFLFTYVFPQRHLGLSYLRLSLIIGYTILTQILALSPLVFSNIIILEGNITPVPGPGMIVFMSDVFGFGLLTIITLVRKYRKFRGLEKIQLEYLILGLAGTFIFGNITNFLLVNILKNSSFVAIGPFFAFILVGTTFYAIIKHRFLDINFLVARSVSYILLVFIFGVVYALIFGLLSSLLITQQLQTNTIATSAILAFIMAFTFQPLRRVLEKTTDRFLYKDHYDQDKLLYNLTYTMASTLRLEDLTHQLLTELMSQMRISQGGFILINDGRIFEFAHEGYKESPSLGEKEISILANQTQILIFEELPEGETKEIMRKLNFSIVANLRTAGDQIGLFALGNKLSGDIYSSEDIKLIEIFVSEAAVAIKNSLSYEEIQRFNITLKEEIKQATANLSRANLKLKELDKLKDEFVSIASHELRTPMTAVKSYLWLAINKAGANLKPEVKNQLQIAYEETEHLIKLVQNLLTISRIESKRLEMNLETFNVYDAAKFVYDELKIRGDEKKMTFTISKPSTPYNIIGDKDQLREVFLNLIGNALKYTPDGGNIEVFFETAEKNIEVHIKDSGPGISDEEQKKLFTKFGRLNQAKNQRTPGTGLGLYISKNIVDLHKGEIKVKSKPGVGTTFIISLPLTQK